MNKRDISVSKQSLEYNKYKLLFKTTLTQDYDKTVLNALECVLDEFIENILSETGVE